MKKKMKLLVCGSRTISDKRAVYFCLDRAIANFQFDHLTVITGAARGADALAHAWASDRGHTNWSVPANWDKDGKMAGFIRNQRMLDLAPDLTFGFFHRTETPGTLDMLQRSKNAGINTRFVILK